MDLNSELTRCPLCGHSYRPDDLGHCNGCPLASGCRTTCCPACGYVDVDARQTIVGRWFGRRKRRGGAGGRQWVGRRGRRHGELSLGDVPPGCLARVASLEGAPPGRRGQLRAYGLVVGDWVRVVRQSPVTVAVVERTELALETGLADCILVDSVTDPQETTSADDPERISSL